MQLAIGLAIALALSFSFSVGPVRADDRVDFTTTWFQEKRKGGLGGLTVIHPQLDVSIDLGEHVILGAGYASDIVTGATAKTYSVDAVSTATKFDDIRQEGHLSLGFQGRRSRLTFNVGVGVEQDYNSLTWGGSGNIDLPGKNTNLALSYTHNRDEVCDRDNSNLTPFERRTLDGTINGRNSMVPGCEKDMLVFGKDTIGTTLWRDVRIDTTQATLTQNMTPTVVAQVSLYGQIIRGFQSNPYRAVRVRGFEAQETVPDTRARVAITVRANKFFPGPRSALHLSLRAYSDTWKVNSGTAEMAWSQYFGTALLLRFRARIYQQSPAKFFKDAFFYEREGEAGSYFTGDRELGKLRHVVLGSKLSYIKVPEGGGNVWGVFDELRLSLKGDLLFMEELAVDSLEDNRDGIEGQFLSSGQFLDGFVLSLSLLLAY